jgi:phage major head subunit gpT-like protein
MIVNAAVLAAVFSNLKTDFNRAFVAAPSQYAKIAMKINSNSTQNDYKWLSNFPMMQKWIGEKAVKSLEAFSYTLINDDWEATVEVDRNHIEDDSLGIYGPQAQMAGFAAATFPDELVFALVNNAFTNVCYDGKAFFATNHKVGTATVSNKGSAALSAATLAAASASFGAARIAIRKFQDDQGRPLNVTPDILLVPPALEDTANKLMTADLLSATDPNPYKASAQVVCDARLTSDTAWFLLCTSRPVKPFIYQERKAATFVQQTDPQADNVFNRRKFRYGAEARAAAGYGFWQLAYGTP